MYLSTTPDDETAKTIIIEYHASTGRRYYTKHSEQKSAWQSLTAGQNYYIEALNYNSEGGDSFSVAVEIEQTAMTGHHHAIKEIQTIGVYVGETNKDTIRIKIENMDSGTFKLAFFNQW